MTIVTSPAGEWVLPGPLPLVDPPLSLLDLAMSRVLIDDDGLVAEARAAMEAMASAQEQLDRIDRLEPGDTPSEADNRADAAEAIAQQRAEWQDALDRAAAWSSAVAERVARQSRWEAGFQYLPELSLSDTATWCPGDVPVAAQGTTASKLDGSNRPANAWYDPFVALGLDDRSAFGWPHSDYAERVGRAVRGLRAHEAFQCEAEFWGGAAIPTNYHLTASPHTPTTAQNGRQITAWPSPTAAPGTTLGTAVGLGTSLAALDQAIADSSAGVGMIHATPYLVQRWMGQYPYIRDSDGKVYTVNHNLLVPGYGYQGVGPDTAARALTDVDTTDGSATITSASAAFTDGDVGRYVTETDGGGHIPAGAYIVSVTNGTTVVLSVAAVGTATGVAASIPGQGGNATGTAKQWAYATEWVYPCRGDVHVYPSDPREMSPALPVDNSMPVRAERSWALLTNRLLRAAVLVDTTLTT